MSVIKRVLLSWLEITLFCLAVGVILATLALVVYLVSMLSTMQFVVLIIVVVYLVDALFTLLQSRGTGI